MTTPWLKGDGTSDRTIVIRDRVGTHEPKDPAGRVRHHFMELPTAIEGKAALFKQFGGADAWPVVLDTQDTDLIVEIVRGGVHVLAQQAAPLFRIPLRPMKATNPSRANPQHVPNRTVVTDCETTDWQSPTSRWVRCPEWGSAESAGGVVPGRR